MEAQSPRVTNIRFELARPADRKRGLLGWVRFHASGLLIDGVTIRRTRAGRLALSFPVRHDAAGRQHPLIRPRDADARRRIEREVFEALEGVLSSLDQPGVPADTNQSPVSRTRSRRSST